MTRPDTTSHHQIARKNALPWVKALRTQLRYSAGRGFTLREQSGTAQLTCRFTDGTRRSCTLGIQWTPEHAPEILTAAVAAATVMRQGEASPARALRQSQLLESTRVDWASLGEAYRNYRVTVLADIAAISFKRKYMPIIRGLVAADPPDAAAAMAAAAVGEPGSRGRAVRLQGTSALLRWGVLEGHLPATWQPPDTKRWLGRRTTPKPKRWVPDDATLVNVVSGLEGDLWLATATLLLTGCRPWELRHLSVVGDCVHVGKGKIYAGGQTATRTIHLLPPLMAPTHWTAAVLAGIAAGGLPNMGANDSRVQSRLIQRLHRHGWPRELTLYAMRHAYGRRSNNVYGLSPRHGAALMGHSLRVHLSAYGGTDNDQALVAARTALDKTRRVGVDIAKMS